jgi:predicted SAM-dependent methyltransferase
VENPSAQKLINKIQLDLFKKGFEAETLIADLKKLREYSLEEQNPVLTKALRLTYEHLEANGAFLIPIPDDEPVDEETELVTGAEGGSENNLESLEYLISLFGDLGKKNNLLDLKEYNKAFLAF